LNKNKYLVLVQIDPEVDPIVEEDSEARIRSDIDTLKNKIDSVQNDLAKTNFNVDAVTTSISEMLKVMKSI